MTEEKTIYQVNDLDYWVNFENSNSKETSIRLNGIINHKGLNLHQQVVFIQILSKAHQQNNKISLADLESGTREDEIKFLPLALKHLEKIELISKIGGKK